MKKLLMLVVFILICVFTYTGSFGQPTANLTDIKYTKVGSQDKVSIYTGSYSGYNVFYLPSPDRLVVDIPNNRVAVSGSSTISVNSAMIKNVRFSQFTTTSARVVIDMKGQYQYTIVKENGCLSIVLGAPAPASSTSSSATGASGTSGATNTASSTSATGSTDTSSATRGEQVRPKGPVNKLTYTTENNIDKIIIPGSNHKGYTTKMLTDPDRIVVDIPNCIAPEDQPEILGNNGLVKKILYTQLNERIARIEIETDGQPQYILLEQEDRLLLNISSPPYKNVIYSNRDDAATLTLKGVKLVELAPAKSTEGSANNSAAESAVSKPLYSETTFKEGKTYVITFPSSLANLSNGLMRINDGLLNTVVITDSNDGQTKHISFNANEQLVYDIAYNQETNDTVINIFRPFKKPENPSDKPSDNLSGRLVVIDAGHGGSDPGAVYAGVQEKDLNLKVALMVDEILRSKGISTYLTRSNDTFVALHDRANIANELNATLFLSIHNNAYNTSEHGTETLCYPSAKGRQFASIIQKNLVSALGTKNRGIVDRPKLVVLYATKMPAALAEIAFITNEGDRKNLLDQKFLEKAAAALADSVIEALDAIK